MIKVVSCGSRVKTIIGNIEALVTGICIREDNRVTYEISYFNQGLSVTTWLCRYEFEVFNQSKKKAGFVNYDTEIIEENKILLT